MEPAVADTFRSQASGEAVDGWRNDATFRIDLLQLEIITVRGEVVADHHIELGGSRTANNLRRTRRGRGQTEDAAGGHIGFGVQRETRRRGSRSGLLVFRLLLNLSTGLVHGFEDNTFVGDLPATNLLRSFTQQQLHLRVLLLKNRHITQEKKHNE